MNAGYQIDSVHAPWVINCGLALGIILGHVSMLNVTKYTTSRDVILLIFTLPNLFMAQNSKKNVQDRSLWFIGPFLDLEWTYSLGFISGMFFPFASFAKHTRFLIISLIILLTLFTENRLYEQILFFLRGLFVYNETKDIPEFYFRLGFVLVDLFIQQYLFNYLFIGYLIIAVVLWQSQPHTNLRPRRLTML